MKRRFGKYLSFVIVTVVLFAAIPSITLGAEVKKVYFTDKKWNEYEDEWNTGDYYLAHDTVNVQAKGERGLEFSGTGQIIYVFSQKFLEECPFLHFKLGDKGLDYIKFTRREAIWVDDGSAPEISITLKPGDQTVNIQEAIKSYPSGNVYISIGGTGSDTKTGQPRNLDYIYLSNTDHTGKVYEKPVQPTVPKLDASREIRYQLKCYDKDTVDDSSGCSWLMSVDDAKKYTIKATPSGKGVILERAEGSTATVINAAWVVPYEQLLKTPYLVIDIENKGRDDEGPRTLIFAYWEGVSGSSVYFDLIPEDIGANSLNGENRLPLLYAVDSVPKKLQGNEGVAVIVQIGIERSDGTTMNPLVIKDAYLLGYKDAPAVSSSDTTSSPIINSEDIPEDEENTNPSESVFSESEPEPETEESKPESEESEQESGEIKSGEPETESITSEDKSGGDNAWVTPIIIGGVILLLAATAVVVTMIYKRKKANERE